jgi:hypothetical protein
MAKLILISSLFLVLTCSMNQSLTNSELMRDIQEPMAQVADPEIIEKIQINTQPGKVRWVSFKIPRGWEKAQLLCRGDQIKHYALAENMRFAYIAESYFSEIKPYACQLQLKNDFFELIEFSLSSYPYK